MDRRTIKKMDSLEEKWFKGFDCANDDSDYRRKLIYVWFEIIINRFYGIRTDIIS
jgi:hypothetical protein